MPGEKMSDAERSAHRAGVLLVTASALFWSTAGLFTRIIVADTPSVATLIGGAIVFAAEI